MYIHTQYIHVGGCGLYGVDMGHKIACSGFASLKADDLNARGKVLRD